MGESRRDETRPTLCPSNEDDANADECYDFRFIAKFPFEQRQRRGHLHHHFADISARPSRSRQPTIPFNSQCSSSGSAACASKNGSVDFCVLLVLELLHGFIGNAFRGHINIRSVLLNRTE